MGTHELNIISHFNLDQNKKQKQKNKTKQRKKPHKNKQNVKSEQNKHLVYRLTIHL